MLHKIFGENIHNLVDIYASPKSPLILAEIKKAFPSLKVMPARIFNYPLHGI